MTLQFFSRSRFAGFQVFLLSRRARAFLSAGAMMLTLGACSPKYDWRSQSDDIGRYSAAYPGKPTLDVRQVEIGGAPLTMRMQTASVDTAVFAIGAILIPADRLDSRQAALDFAMQGIARNVGTGGQSHAIQTVAADGRTLSGTELRASGLVPGTKQNRSVVARFAATDNRVYEAVIVSNEPLPKEQVDQFFDAFKPF